MAVQANQKDDALNRAILQIDKQFGKGSVMRLGERPRQLVPCIATGCMPLDIALGIGGLPRGRIVEIFGPESSGKTTLALHVIAEAQKTGGICAFVDAEHALDPIYARKLGVKVDELLISQPDYGEQALEITDVLVRSGTIDCVAIDSVAALVPKAEIDGEMGDSFMGVQARLMSQALRKLSGTLSRTNTTAIFINQLREKIGVMFGNPEVTPGGRALKFWASVRIEVRRIESIKQGAEVVGNRVRAKVVKNKMAPPFREAEFEIIFGKGVSRAGGILDVAEKMGIVNKSGTWWSYGDSRIGQGKDNARSFLDQHPDTCNEIEGKIRASMQAAREEDLGVVASAEEEEEEPEVEEV